MKYETIKLFDSIDLPDDLRQYLLGHYECGNDSYVRWSIGNHTTEVAKKLDQWLIDNGASEDESVMFSYWW